MSHVSVLDRSNPVVAGAVLVGRCAFVGLVRRVPWLPAPAIKAGRMRAQDVVINIGKVANAAPHVEGKMGHGSARDLCGLGGGGGEQRLQCFCDPFDRLDAGLRHVAPANARDGVVMDASTISDQAPVTAAFVGVKSRQHVVEFHANDYADTPSFGQAHPHKADRHDRKMEEKPGRRKGATQARSVLMSNLGRLIGASSVNAWALEHQLTQSSVARVLSGKTQPTTDQLEKLAIAGGVEPWQLLAPDLGAHLYRVTASRQFVPVYVIPQLDEDAPETTAEDQPTAASQEQTTPSQSKKTGDKEWRGATGFEERAKSAGKGRLSKGAKS